MKRKILVVLVDRANFGRLWPVMKAIQSHQQLELMTLCSGTMVLERFGSAVDTVDRMGFPISGRVYMEVEGSLPLTMAKSVGFGIVEFTSEFGRLQPDIVLLIGDRYEALAAAIAAAYSNITLAHIQGGEVTGSIDESARHAITKMAQYHFPATRRAGEYIIRMGEQPETVFTVGCPCGDFIRQLDKRLPPGIFSGGDPQVHIDPGRPYYLVVYHPVTTEFGCEKDQIIELLYALDQLKHPTIWLWPNIDAGSDHISKELRRYRSLHKPDWLKVIVNFSPEDFQRVLYNSVCAIGNSSSFVRDSTFTGVPVVLVGSRQEGRETGTNVVMVPPLRTALTDAITAQTANGRYRPDGLYGDGHASTRIVDILSSVPLYTQKRLGYIRMPDDQTDAGQVPVSPTTDQDTASTLSIP